ncbi:amidase-like protein [Coniella lustricola]|uniref:Amidase-like protein n=1 Tax=Coniella lustricola TaxID=2025994 RepID=A0A2T3A4G7_9PEZI|nr:amidase-like protein [Coniella lustricola]
MVNLQHPAHVYQQLMRDGHLSSQDLVSAFLDQIDRHNGQGLGLRAVLSVCPKETALAQARQLDEERRRGETRSELHGIPIIIKDAIVTHPCLGMTTTAGSCAIASLTAKRNATVVELLIKAGVIVLGKGNMTEFSGMKSNNTPMGWSGYGGQTLSAFRRPDLDEKDQPVSGGSSAGPAVSVAAGFSPLAIGTETGGSNVLPASMNALYGLTLPHRSVPMDGVAKIADFTDRIGLMAHNPRDLLSLVKILLMDTDSQGKDSSLDMTTKVADFGGLSVGVLDSQWGTHSSSDWKWGSQQVKQEYASVAEKLGALGARVTFPLRDPPEPSLLKAEGETLMTVCYHEFPGVLRDFIATNFEHDPNIRDLRDIVAWNQAHAERAMPEPYTTQTELIASLHNTMDQKKHDAAAAGLRHLGRQEGMAKMMRDLDLDIVLSASDAELISFSASAGWPVATVPVSKLTKNDQPWGMFALPRDGRLDLLARFLIAFGQHFGDSRGPKRPFEGVL